MTYLDQEIQHKLDIYYKKYNHKYTKCLIRGIEIPFNNRPEEFVRQLFLYFLINESGLLPDKVNIKVESNNHDIELYKKQNPNFSPYQTPLVIVETKREDIYLQNYYGQIQRYLTNAGCNIGILYNFHEIISFTRQGNEFEITYLENIRDIKELILQKYHTNYDDNIFHFEQAHNGNLNSFIYLIKKYGKYITNTIFFKIKSQLAEIQGCSFMVRDTNIYYKISGQTSQKHESFDFSNFEKLIAIRY
ncbi:type I restriction enzyme HsdR N-terminal domain-containing protein [Nostoc sp. CCY0012]|uniref:type I restriction enzyme HsdR N-terminal domain-containing protein n=1 Tax=Nostoc sp. CCY0012 TaxID=1056123 RepID=UPI0039C69A75